MNQDPNKHKGPYIETSAILTFISIVILFSGAVIITLLAPRYVDPTWTTPTCSYQAQMYEQSDPNLYISRLVSGSSTLQAVYHLKNNDTLLAFHETDTVRIVAPEKLQEFITRLDEPTLKLTSHLMLLRKPVKNDDFDADGLADRLRTDLQTVWEKEHPKWEEEKLTKPDFEILELFEPKSNEAFSLASSDGSVENWVEENYKILDSSPQQPFHTGKGVIYVNNPQEYRMTRTLFNEQVAWHYNPNGEPITDFQELQKHPLGFKSRAELISAGEQIYAAEGCYYCHTDQTRTLVQDVVANGSDSYPAPPSSASEYIYQKITFPGTRRIGPDLSRVGIKRPSRDWHKSHFWSPKTASAGSIMPSFRHFFDNDPRGTSKNTMGIPNYRFEAIFQYLMTKGTRITPPTQAWWLGEDPLRTKEIIEGRQKIPK